jgi:SAM-dependent methyltransferase
MKPRRTQDDGIAQNNLRAYAGRRSVEYWSSYSEELLTAERAIFTRISGEIRDKPLLDVGVGGGRTTPHLLRISSDYVGVDFAPAMIAACRQKFAKVTFLQCDARELASLGQERFALVFFSFNGIDYVNDDDRQKIYAAVHRVLVPGGYFLFSSHNLRDDRERMARPWQLPRQNWRATTASPRDFMRTLYHFAVQNSTYMRLRHAQVRGSGFSILLDRGQLFRHLAYYIDPVEQVRQLESSGFKNVRVHDRAGMECAAHERSLDAVNPVHYLARKC